MLQDVDGPLEQLQEGSRRRGQAVLERRLLPRERRWPWQTFG